MAGSANIADKATNAVKWSALTEMVARTATPIITVILARLLSPTDFGVVATAMIAINFAQLFWDAGLSKALIQTNEAPEEAAQVVFWTNLSLGITIYGLLFITAPWVAIFFESPTSGPVLRILGLQIIIASLSSVQQALLVRDLNFRPLFLIKLGTSFLPGLFSIPMAFYGYGVWALVAGTLVGQTANLILLWYYSDWRPRFQYNYSLAHKMFNFGLWVLMGAFGGWLIMSGDGLIVGKFLGVKDLGLYQTGAMIVMVIFNLIFRPLLPVIYSSFSRLQDDLPALIQKFQKLNRIVIALALPLGVGLLLIGPELVAVLFTSKWQELGLVLRIQGLTFGVSWLVGVNSELFRALGRPDATTKLSFMELIFWLPAFILAARSGLETFLYTRLALTITSLPLHVYFCRRILGLSPFYLWHEGKYSMLASITMGVGLGIIKWGFKIIFITLPQGLTLPLLIAVGVGIYFLTLWLIDKAFVVQTSRLVRRVVFA